MSGQMRSLQEHPNEQMRSSQEHPNEQMPSLQEHPKEQVSTTADSAPDGMVEDALRSALEAMLLVIDSPATAAQLARAVGEPAHRVEQLLRAMSAELTARASGIDLRFAGDGWRYYTRAEFAPYVETMLGEGARTKLTRAALETLAVVAYRQPVTRARISAVRGVNVDGVVRTLLARGLITEAAPDPDSGGVRYVTTELFLERLGISSLAELPEYAPLLPDVELIDEINDSTEMDARLARLRKQAEPGGQQLSDEGAPE